MKQVEIHSRNIAVLEDLKRVFEKHGVREIYTNYDLETFVLFEDEVEIHLGTGVSEDTLTDSIDWECSQLAKGDE